MGLLVFGGLVVTPTTGADFWMPEIFCPGASPEAWLNYCVTVDVRPVERKVLSGAGWEGEPVCPIVTVCVELPLQVIPLYSTITLPVYVASWWWVGWDAIWEDLCQIEPTCSLGVEGKVQHLFLLGDGDRDGVIDGIVAEVGDEAYYLPFA